MSLRVIARRHDEAIQIQSYNNSYKSSHLGFIPSIMASFADLEPALICFSLSMASLIETYSSKYPNLSTPYLAVKLFGWSPVLCS